MGLGRHAGRSMALVFSSRYVCRCGTEDAHLSGSYRRPESNRCLAIVATKDRELERLREDPYIESLDDYIPAEPNKRYYDATDKKWVEIQEFYKTTTEDPFGPDGTPYTEKINVIDDKRKRQIEELQKSFYKNTNIESQQDYFFKPYKSSYKGKFIEDNDE